MNYYKIIELNVKEMYVIADSIEDQDSESVEFDKVFIIMNKLASGSYIITGSESFFVYNSDNPDKFDVQEISFNLFLKTLRKNSAKIKNKHDAIKAFFEPNKDGNN